MYIYINNTKHNWVATEAEAQKEVDFLVKQFENSPVEYVIDIRLSTNTKTAKNIIIPEQYKVFKSVVR